jgi:hypothetical protein
MMTTKTFTVEHEGTHYPTEQQMAKALRDVLKADDQKLSGDVEFHVVENTSGGPSKVRATFESEPTSAAKKDDKTTTMTAGGKAKSD